MTEQERLVIPSPPVSPKRGKKKALIIASIAFAVLIVAGAVVGGILWANSGEKVASTSSDQTTTDTGIATQPDTATAQPDPQANAQPNATPTPGTHTEIISKLIVDIEGMGEGVSSLFELGSNEKEISYYEENTTDNPASLTLYIVPKGATNTQDSKYWVATWSVPNQAVSNQPLGPFYRDPGPGQYFLHVVASNNCKWAFSILEKTPIDMPNNQGTP